jgi:hypothetical protein
MMGILQKMIESSIDEILKEEVVVQAIKSKINELGLTLNKSQIEYIRKKAVSNSVKNLKLNFDDGVVSSSSIYEKGVLTKKVTIDVSQVDNLDEIVRSVSQKLVSSLPKLVDELADKYVSDFKRKAPSRIKPIRKQKDDFELSLFKKWEKPLNLFEYYLNLTMELGGVFNREFRPIAAKRNDHIFEALARLHARSSQVSFEILNLLKSGFADGAHARWRTLHEIAVVAIFISEYGNNLANRYLCYDGIDIYKAADIYQKNCIKLGYEQLSNTEYEKIKKKHDKLIKKFGNKFGRDYGWAAEIFPEKGRIHFSDIEEKVGMQHMRSYYKMACNNVHANPRGVFFRLGLSNTKEDILLSGPSNTGLADPANGTALSICQITTTFLLHETNIDRIVESKALLSLNDEIQSLFTETQLELEKQPMTYQKIE